MLGGIPSFDDWEKREAARIKARRRIVEALFCGLAAACAAAAVGMLIGSAFVR